MDPNAIIEIFRRNVTDHYFDLKGRVSRREFWLFVLACFVVAIGMAVVESILRTHLLGPVLGLGLLLPMTGMGARRLQDTGKDGTLVWLWAIPSGAAQLIALLMAMTGPIDAMGFLYFFFSVGWLVNLVAFIAALAMIYFWVQPGAESANQYGPAPT